MRRRRSSGPAVEAKMPDIPVRRMRSAAPWWLMDITEICPACNHGYAYQTEFYCIDCDGAVCPICVQRRVSLEIVCPGCFQSQTSGESE
jgi:hypothetical protein